MGNAPIGMWFQTLTEDLRARSKMYGFRQYFMKAIVVDLYNTGPVILNDRICSDYAWISQVLCTLLFLHTAIVLRTNSRNTFTKKI